jgi:F0F1-type ATP synthase assembly protein I
MHDGSRQSPAGSPARPSSPWAKYGRYGALAFEFSGTIGGAAAAGYFLDRACDAAPWFVLTFTLIGVVGGFARLVRILRHFDRQGRES